MPRWNMPRWNLAAWGGMLVEASAALEFHLLAITIGIVIDAGAIALSPEPGTHITIAVVEEIDTLSM